MTPNESTPNPYRQAGLKVVEDTDLQETLLKNYGLLTATFAADAVLREEVLIKKAHGLLETKGYFIGKDLLLKLLQEDFAEYDLVQLSLVVPGNVVTDSTSGQLGILFRGAFPSSNEPTTQDEESQSADDPRFRMVSSIAYLAGELLSGPSPDPDTLGNPPYGE